MTTLKHWPAKYPEERLDYKFDWVNLLDGDTITGTVIATPLGSVGLTIDAPVSTVGTVSTLWISGGAPSQTSRVLLKATTAGGRTIEYEVRLPVRSA